MLEEHKEELKNLKTDLEELYAHNEIAEWGDDALSFSTDLLTLVEGRISDLESMIAIDNYWKDK